MRLFLHNLVSSDFSLKLITHSSQLYFMISFICPTFSHVCFLAEIISTEMSSSPNFVCLILTILESPLKCKPYHKFLPDQSRYKYSLLPILYDPKHPHLKERKGTKSTICLWWKASERAYQKNLFNPSKWFC